MLLLTLSSFPMSSSSWVTLGALTKGPGIILVFLPGPLVKSPKVTQDQYDMEKDDKVRSSIEVSKHTSVFVIPHLLLKTPPKFKNKRDYIGDTHDKTLDSSTKDTNIKKKDDSLKSNLDKETNNADDDEYIDNPPLQIDNIKSQPQENLINRLLLKRFTIK